MMLSFYDPEPVKHGFLTTMYLEPLRQFCIDRGMYVQDIPDIMAVRGATVLIGSHHLTPEVILRLKENGNRIVSFDVNDNSAFTETYDAATHFTPGSDAILNIDLIFKIAGIQKTRESWETVIDDDLNYKREKLPFIGGDLYFRMKEEGRLLPLPHKPFVSPETQSVTWEKRTRKALVRGGHHYLRVHLFLNLLAKGLIDGNSGFFGSLYRHQFCDDCKHVEKITYEYLRAHPNMKCRLKNWPHGFMTHSSHWNNSCIPRYLDLAELSQISQV
jgi:hypothetical protein